MAILTRVRVPGESSQWQTLGFDAGPEGFLLGHTWFELGAEHMAWGFDEIRAEPESFGVPTFVAAPVDGEAAPPRHPNHIHAIDHVVYSVPDLDGAIERIESALDLRLRRRARPRGPEGPEMAFFRAGDPVIEVVGGRGFGLFGVAFLCDDLDATVAAMRATEAPVGDPKPAVQGGRIASVWRGFTGMPIAIMEPKR